MSQNFKKVCDKQNMLLEYNKESNIYSLLFDINNQKNTNISQLLNNDIYELLKKLNKEIIYDVVKIVEKDNENIILFIFQEIGKEAGLKQKYMFLNNRKLFENNKIIFDTKSLSKQQLLQNNLLNDEILNKISNLQEVKCEFAKLTINTKENIINMHYIFKIIVEEDLPKYLENITGLLIKKIFLNLKLFIENN